MNRLAIITFFALLINISFAQKSKQEFYEMKIYTLKDKSQQERVDAFLKDSYIPYLHKAGIKNVGVFIPFDNDTIIGRKVFVLVPYASLDQFTKVTKGLATELSTTDSGKSYVDAVYSNPPYERIESILLSAFPGMPSMATPVFSTPKTERVYELRSYESATEKIYRSKVKMFNVGDEIGLFKRLGFNAVFYADVIAGSRMPNLMYMTTFSNRVSRDEHWKAFVDDAQWKSLKAMEEYQNNVSKNTIYFLHPTEYSDY